MTKGRPPKFLAGMDDPNSLLAWYLKVIASQKDALQEVCKTIVADAYFSFSCQKQKFPQFHPIKTGQFYEKKQ